MAAEQTWEEIAEWEYEEEDIELAKRITVHSIPNPVSIDIDNIAGDGVEDNDEGDEYQFIQNFKAPTYAAATKWGTPPHTNNSSKNTKNTDNTNNENSDSSSSSPVSPVATFSKKHKAAKRMVAQNEIAASDSETSSVTINFGDDEASDLHLVNESPGARSAARRANAHVHKLQAKRLQAQLVSTTELEFWENSARGDTNRNPQFVKSKICKKAMKYSKGDKKDRKGLQKFKTEVW
ncbi:9584_t:CDS:1 [Ambispora gerdemannii]|uniref:9584_t:CDS:1 n=1 Tax=Ambispora gerdemannii TaxID=144530 RepID=A0A9N9F1L7_9GLOM|nr:9584_t:CDS:1 [Ambispora gerdemannii]